MENEGKERNHLWFALHSSSPTRNMISSIKLHKPFCTRSFHVSLAFPPFILLWSRAISLQLLKGEKSHEGAEPFRRPHCNYTASSARKQFKLFVFQERGVRGNMRNDFVAEKQQHNISLSWNVMIITHVRRKIYEPSAAFVCSLSALFFGCSTPSPACSWMK